MSQEPVVYIGKKPLMNYVLACLTLFHGGAKEVTIKARGRAISRAVDVAEIIRNRFLQGSVEYGPIEIDTEMITTKDGVQKNASTISIVLRKK